MGRGGLVDIWLDSMTVPSEKGLLATQARDIFLHQVKLITRETPVYREDNTAHITIR